MGNMSFFAVSLRFSFYLAFASNRYCRTFARFRSRAVLICCLYIGLASLLSDIFLTIFRFSLDWSFFLLSWDTVSAEIVPDVVCLNNQNPLGIYHVLFFIQFSGVF